MPQWEAHQPPDASEPVLYAHVNVHCEQHHRMVLAIRHDATLRQLDQFLRDTWLERCYTRLSAFRFGEMTVDCDDMDPKLRNSLHGLDTSFLATFDTTYIRTVLPGCTVFHHYNFGGTIETTVTTLGPYTIPDHRPIVVIARKNHSRMNP